MGLRSLTYYEELTIHREITSYSTDQLIRLFLTHNISRVLLNTISNSKLIQVLSDNRISESTILKQKELVLCPYIPWANILSGRQFSEGFLLKVVEFTQIYSNIDYIHKVDTVWKIISLKQAISQNFIKQNKENITFRYLSQNIYIDDTLKIYYEYEIMQDFLKL